MTRSRLTTLIATISCATALAACGDDEDQETPVAVEPPAQTTPAPAAPKTDAETPAGECRDVDPPAAKTLDTPKPKGRLSTSAKHVVTVQTSCGTIEITLDAKNHPITANAFAALVKDKAFNGTGFHRVVPGFVIQGGDPEGTGMGGPSWKAVEAPGSGAQYTRGVVAMAKGGPEPAGTFGSQFFIVTGPDAGLPPDYAIAGKVTKGMEVADAISELGQPGTDGPPTRAAVIETATLK